MIKYDKIKETINKQNLDVKDFKKKDHVNELKENVVNENGKKESFDSNFKQKKHIEFIILFLIIILLACILCLIIVLAKLELNNDQ
jgi:lipopolysaccharide/colanic/teichoic acid biosynthesis glycosyltransferase